MQFLDLPSDLVRSIFILLPLTDLVSLALVSKKTERLALSEELFAFILKSMGYRDVAEDELFSSLHNDRFPGGCQFTLPASYVSESNKSHPSPVLVKPRNSKKQLFRRVFVELNPYFMELKNGGDKLLLDFPNPVDHSSVFRLLKLLGNSSVYRWMKIQQDLVILSSIHRKLEDEQLKLFANAFDAAEIEEMKTRAYICYQLNGGRSCANLLIGKCRIFSDDPFKFKGIQFDGSSGHNFLSGLLTSFSAFMSDVSDVCLEQEALIDSIFPIEMDVRKTLISRVFQESIREYLSSLLDTTRIRTGLFLLSLANSIEACLQFSEQHNSVDILAPAISQFFVKYTDGYLSLELEFMKSQFVVEGQKWEKAVCLLYI